MLRSKLADNETKYRMASPRRGFGTLLREGELLILDSPSVC